MREFLLALAAAALIAAAGLVAAQSQSPTAQSQSPAAQPQSPAAQSQQPVAHPQQPATPGPMRLAAIDTSNEAFRKLDTDHDGRISALEANQNPRLAALFPMADKNKDGYLSKEEFEAISTALPKAPEVDATSPDGDQASYPSGDEPATSPRE